MAPKAEEKPSRTTSGKLGGRPSRTRSRRLGGRSSRNLKVKSSTNILGKTGTESKPPPPVIPSKVKWFWIVLAVMIFTSLLAATVMFILYRKAKAAKTPYDEAFRTLKGDLKYSFSCPDLEYGSAPEVATEVQNLGEAIRSDYDHLEIRKKKYRKLLQKYMRSASGPWKLHGRSLYYFSKAEKTWYDAEIFCLSRDAHLASVLNDEEQDFIHSHLEQSSWIGLTVQNEEGAWGWSDGSRLVTQYWADGKPRGAESFWESSQDCTLMVPSLSAYNWNDENCYEQYGWICKQDLDLDVP